MSEKTDYTEFAKSKLENWIEVSHDFLDGQSVPRVDGATLSIYGRIERYSVMKSQELAALRENLAQAQAERDALKDAKLIATHLLIDVQTFFNSEVKVCNGIGCEFELGILDSISAYLYSYGTEGNVKGDE